MKKNRIITILAMAGAALVLAACSARIDVVPAVPHNYRFVTNWETSDTKAHAACDNQTTVLQYSFRMDRASRIDYLVETYTGVADTSDIRSRVVNPDSSLLEVERSGGADIITVTRTIPGGTNFLPASIDESGSELSSQAIVVRPKPGPSQQVNNGGSWFELTVHYGADGEKSFPLSRIYNFANCSSN